MAPIKSKKKPSPQQLLAEVKGQGAAKKYEFEDYLDVVEEMIRKQFSYAKIAQFLTERLGYAISRGQVYRAYNLRLEAQAMADKEREEQEEVERMAADAAGTIDFADDPEEDAQQRAVREAAADVLKYLGEKRPGTSPLEVAKWIVVFLDDDARSEFEAAEADKRQEQEAIVKPAATT